MTDQKNGQEYLSFVLEKLQARLAEISQSLLDGQKEIENMHDYYWQNYTEMDQYGYEDYDNQQALLHQVNANQERFFCGAAFGKCWILRSSGVWISAMTGMMSRKFSISASAILQSDRASCR